MGESLSKLFVPLHSLPGLYSLAKECNTTAFKQGLCVLPTEDLDIQFGGLCQLLFLAMAYGYVLFSASNLIAEGSELLLLIPQIAPLVGSVVIPILGAVPDGAMVLFSGLGDNAQEQLQVGVGALAGSTIMLLTIPWTLSVVAGRVSVVNGKCTYRKPAGVGNDWQKLDKNSNIFTHTGVEPAADQMASGARTIAITALSYVIIQGAAFAFYGENDDQLVHDERIFALAGMILCIILFAVYLVQQMKNSDEDIVLQQIVDDKRQRAIKMGLISLQGAFHNALSEYRSSDSTRLLGEQAKSKRFEYILRKFFGRYDINGDQCIDASELKLLLDDLHVRSDQDYVKSLLNEMDTDHSGDIRFDEFVNMMLRLVTTKPTPRGETDALTQLRLHHDQMNDEILVPEPTSAVSEEDGNNTDEEAEDVPEDLAHLPPDQQQRAIIFRSLKLMGLGTFLVLLFSDPMVDVLSEIGEVVGVSSFYVSFVLAPLASNASELIASYSYALRKTQKTITISLTSLEGAAIMNNTFCLGTFLALVYFRKLEWKFSAETISILFVEMSMVFVATRRVQTFGLGMIVLALFPISLILVAVLENVIGLD